MEFNLLGRKIELTEGHKNYIETVTYFQKLADKAVCMFNVDTVNAFLEKYGDRGIDNFIKGFILEARDFLAKKGAYTVSDNEIWDGIVDDSEHQYEHSMAYLKFCKIEEELRYEADNLDLDSDDYTKYVLAGFLNTINASNYEIPIRIDIMAMCDFCIDYLYKNEVIPMAIVSQESANEAKAIYKNLKRDNIPAEKLKDVVFEMLNKDYAEYDYYLIAFEAVPESRYEIYRIASFLGFNLLDCVQKVLETDFNLNKITSEYEALEMMKQLQFEMQKYGIEDCKTKSKLEKIIHKYDVEARTYEGIVYETRELCAQAKADDTALKNLYGEVKKLDKIACQEYLSQVDNTECIVDIKKKHIKILQERIKNIDISFLQKLLAEVKNFDKDRCIQVKSEIEQYDTAKDIKDPFLTKINSRLKEIDKENLQLLLSGLKDFSEQECDTIKEKISAYDTTDDIKAPFLSQIDKRLYEIWDAEDFERFTGIYFETQPSSFEKIKENAELIKKEGRTETKELFYKALYELIIPSVEDAAKYAVAKESGLFSSLVNMGKKGTYETLTLNGRLMHPALLSAMEKVKAEKSNGIFSKFGFKKNVTATPVASSAKFCSACGTKIDGNSKFCSNCGNKLN